MLITVIDQSDNLLRLLVPIDADAGHGRPAAVAEGDVIERFAIPVVDLEGGPGGRDQGAKRSLSTSRYRPRRDSVMSRYIQPAEPVYQVHPPRPV